MKKFDALTASQMAEVDRLMVEEYHIELAQMMENAGRQLATMAFKWKIPAGSPRSVTILVGPGNNGGGGLTAARYLSNWGASVSVIMMQPVDKLKPVPLARWQALQKLSIKSSEWAELEVPKLMNGPKLVIDAMLGYNQVDDPYGSIREAILVFNALNLPVLALDIPSGLDATTGIPGIPCIKADATLTLAIPKTGLMSAAGRRVSGHIYVADIGVPPVVYTHLGLPEQHLFHAGTIVKLS